MSDMIIAQISDTHVKGDGALLAGRFDTEAALERLSAGLRRLPTPPDLILFTGDLTEDATPPEYRRIDAALRPLDIPVRAVPGNHDLRAPMAAALPDWTARTAEGHLCMAEDGFPLALLGLDTIVEGAAHGALCAERLDWLEAALAARAGRPVLIFQHHPPIVTGLRAMDRIGLREGRERQAELVARHGGVVAILCGHMHRAIHGVCGGAPVCVAPSASHQIAFDLRPDAPWRFCDEPARIMIHVWDAATGLVSHSVSLDHRSAR